MIYTAPIWRVNAGCAAHDVAGGRRLKDRGGGAVGARTAGGLHEGDAVSDLPEDDQPHPVEGPEYVPICAVCMRTVSLVGPQPNCRWSHDELGYDVEEP